MKVGAHTFGFIFEADAQATLARLIEAGFLDFELMATPPHFDPWSSPAAVQRRLRALLEGAGARLHALDLASSDVNLASLAPRAAQFAVDAYLALIARAAEIGARAVCVGSGRRHGLLPQANGRLLGPFHDAFARIVRAARSAGVGVFIENQPTGLLADAPSIARFLADPEFSDVRVIYDVDNAAAVGEPPTEGFARLGERIALAHVSDSPRGEWRHGPLGSGAIDIAAALDAAARHAPQATVIVEILSPTPFDDTLRAREFMRGIAAGLPRTRTGLRNDR